MSTGKRLNDVLRIVNLSGGHMKCPICGGHMVDKSYGMTTDGYWVCLNCGYIIDD